VIVTRADIPKGYQTVQSAHAIADFAHRFPETFKKWKSESNSIIVLSVKDEKELKSLFIKLKRLSAETIIFYEPDVSALTSLCVYGSPEIRKKLSYLPLI